MATGWAHEGAVLDQIDDTINDGVTGARSRLPRGDGRPDCIECGEDIPPARRLAMPGVSTCVACQSARDGQVSHTLFNRRGSKDSQPR